MIVLDDQNSFALRHDLAPEPVTPNLDRLAARGVAFAHAQCAAPVCNPSRAALFSGLRPATSGVYDNDQGRLKPGNRLERATSLPGYFRERGYMTAGSGKIFAASLGSTVGKEVWDESEPPSARGKGHGPRPPKEKLPLNGIGKHDWGGFPKRDEMEDWLLAGWAAEFLAQPHAKPFFLACGIVKPHTPWYVPQAYFDLFPPERITIPDLSDDENAGLPAVAREKRHRTDEELVRRRKELVAAYLAASRYADDCLGRIVDALNHSHYRDNTIVVVCGDNGYQFGERNSWTKGKLWEGSTQVPLVFAGPSIVRGQVCTHAVSLLDIYPTLLALAGLPANSQCDGFSLAPLLADPAAPWDHPALTTKGFQNHAVRSDRWRYIRYADGSEELYDHDADPLERSNLATLPESAVVKDNLRKYLPQHDEPRVVPLSKGDDD
jgi:arylsulfatase A-like enzyme